MLWISVITETIFEGPESKTILPDTLLACIYAILRAFIFIFSSEYTFCELYVNKLEISVLLGRPWEWNDLYQTLNISFSFNSQGFHQIKWNKHVHKGSVRYLWISRLTEYIFEGPENETYPTNALIALYIRDSQRLHLYF